MCPDLGEMGPLNTAEGQAFVLKLIDRIGGVDAVFLDNRMSLLSGDMKEEQPWTDTMKLVKELTRRRIAQVWIDHTGHDTGRIYGTKTKEWQFDTVALMEKADRPGCDIAFSLKFEVGPPPQAVEPGQLRTDHRHLGKRRMDRRRGHQCRHQAQGVDDGRSLP